ncbi:DUF4055 domain-containing protein [Candidatus Pacearchaeota archaeon]|nr:DUF4055 domain-containing protein [Candidatus Pacearchaeota archaeon]
MKDNIHHPEYQIFSKGWKICRDCFKGTRAVKGAKSEYLPALSDKNDNSYGKYLKRAVFDPIYQDIIITMKGAIVRKETTFKTELQQNQKDLLDTISIDAVSYSIFEERVVQDLLITSRYGILIDMALDGKTGFFAGYPAESILNWNTDIINGKRVLTEVYLEESKKVFEDHISKTEVQRRVLKLDGGVYKVEIWIKKADDSKNDNWTLSKTIIPTKNGVVLNFIPFVFINQNDLTPDAYESSTLGIAELNISHYQSFADLENGRHFAGIPTIFASGVEVDFELSAGADTFNTTSNPEAKCFYVEYEGKGLDELTLALDDKKNRMYALGLKFSEEKAGVEAVESQKVRRYTGTNSLINTVIKAEEGLNNALAILTDWVGVSEIKAILNKDFISSALDPKMIDSLKDLREGFHITEETLLYNLKQGELFKPGHSVQDEQDGLEAENNKPFAEQGE